MQQIKVKIDGDEPKTIKPSGGQTTRSVLLIDDDEVFSTQLQAEIEKNGIKVYTANSGSDGIHMAKQFAPDLIVMDQFLPQTDGTSVMNIIHSTDWGKEQKILTLTAYDIRDLRKVAQQEDAIGYIVKTTEMPQIVSQITKLVTI